MGTLFYVIANLTGFIDEIADVVNLCFLVSLDSIAAVLLLHLRVMLKQK